MKTAIFIFLLSFGVLRADQLPVSTAYKILSENSEKLDSLTKLPVIVRIALTEKIGVTADRGEAFSVGCTGSDPFRRFIQAGHSSNYWWIHYESGGRAHSSSVIIYEIKNQKAFCISECHSGIFLPDFDTLLNSIKFDSGKNPNENH